MSIVQQRQRRAHPAVHFRPPTHPAKFDADAVAQHSYIRCGSICMKTIVLCETRLAQWLRRYVRPPSVVGSNPSFVRKPTLRVARLSTFLSSPLHLDRSSFFSSFVLHLDRQRTKRLSASGLGMDIHMLHRHKRPSQGNNLTYLRGMGFVAPLIRTAREIRLIT